MPTSAKKRARSAARARTALPQKRRASSSQVLARRGMIIVGIAVAGSLLIALVATFSAPDPAGPGTQPSASDPKQLIRAATANPNDSDTVGNLADYYDQTGQYPQALVLYQRYLVLRPDDVKARVN